MINSPLVSVLMPVFNGERYLREAVESVLGQTYSNIEFIIIDDGSTDNSYELLLEYQHLDNRISLHRHLENKGLVFSLNECIDLAEGKYLARMDADDICLPERIENQVEFLEKNSEIGILGSAIELFHSIRAKSQKWIYPLDDLSIKWELLLSSQFAHPAVMIRKSSLYQMDHFYSQEYSGFEDYELWTRLLISNCGANLEKILLKHRVHQDSITSNYDLGHYQKLFKMLTGNIYNEFSSKKFMEGELENLLIVFYKVNYPIHKANKALAAVTYLNLWNNFKEKNITKDTSCVLKIQRNVIRRAARYSVFSLFQPHNLQALQLLWQIDKRWPLIFLSDLPMLIQQRLNFQG
jgi:glycosyltransferase involved in cell wall biosynthesis